jgi:tetratricopeptide (TPR) repeat protein/uncharacterized caspase-like protein
MPKKLLSGVILCVALTVSVSAQQSNQGARTWAVVIGISKYQRLPGGQQLQFADRDASLFVEAIQKRGVNPQNVKLLTGGDATSAAIKTTIGNWLARSVSEQDTVLIFFSGHGLFEKEFGESYLLGYDSDPKDPYGTALSVSELTQAFSRRVRSNRVLLIADAVRRDFFDPDTDTNSSKAFAQSFDQFTSSRPGLFTILANGPGEFSREGQRWTGHGAFAKHLADVLLDGADRNGDLAIAADDLFDLLKGRVADDTSGKQHPWRSGSVSRAEVARSSRGTSPRVMPAEEPVRKPVESSVTPPKATEEKRTPDTQTQRTPTPSAVVELPPPGAAERQSASKTTNAPGVERQTAPGTVSANRPSQPPASVVNPTKPDSAAVKKTEPVEATVKNKNPEPAEAIARVTDSSTPTAGTPKNDTAARVAEKPTGINNSTGSTRPATRQPVPPRTETVKTQPSSTQPRELARAEINVGEPGTPPRPVATPPGAVVVSSDRVTSQPETASASVPVSRPDAAPSPTVLQLEAAIASRSLIEPRNSSAWDLYQRMLSEPAAAADAARLKPALAQALVAQGRALIGGDVRIDNVADKVDDFKRAGQMFARARSLTGDNAEISVLEKLSAAGALISLQFYDEAERALMPLQATKQAAIENALGLVYQGKLDGWRAERAFKRASELDPKWSTPHYNLALLYRSQQNQAALNEFEAAASADPSNVSLLTALGDEYFSRQQWKQAGDAFRKAIALKPTDDNLHTKLGHALYSQGLQDEANREYQKAQELRRRQ